jgi:hypothetical protein
MLLRSPERFAQLVAQDKVDVRASMILTATSLGFYALYGLAMGSFAGGSSLWQAMLKTPMILLGSVLLCAPGLFILRSLAGEAISLRQTVALLSGLTCATSVVMVAFSPVTWLFGVSTQNVQFMVVLHGVVWGMGLACGLRLVALATPGSHRENKTILAWAGIFLVVTAQMLTHFRPILGADPRGAFREGKKQFFFQHLYASMMGKPDTVAPPVTPQPAPTPASGILPVAAQPRVMSN